MAEVKLFRTWSSPYALRIVWALNIKGIEYETIYEDISNKSASLLEYNPVHKKVPVLVHNGKPICESLVILEYIDETWTHNPILPQDSYEKSEARFWAKFNDEKLLPSVWRVFTSQEKEKDEAMKSALQNLKFLEIYLKEKIFFGGETIGYLDLAFGWMANLIGILEKVSGLKLVDAESSPLLSAWMQNFSNAHAIKESWPPEDKLITKFQAMRESYLAAAAAAPK